MIYLKQNKNQKLLKKTLNIKYNKKTTENKLLKLSKKRSQLQKIEKLYKTILLSKQ